MFDLGRPFLAVVERSPDALAIVDGERRLSYAAWYSEISRVAGGLAALGRRGVRLVVILQNQRRSTCRASRSAARRVRPAASKNWPLLRAAARRRPDPEDLSLLFYTSGTTGRPKGVPHRHRAERAAALAHVAQNLYCRGERTLAVMPLCHTMGVRSLLAVALVDGVFVCLQHFDPAAALRSIARERITSFHLVPTLYHDLVGHPDFATCDIGSVTKLGFAGATMPDGLLKRVDAAFRPASFVNHYGSSEIYPFTTEPRAAAKPGSAGNAGLNCLRASSRCPRASARQCSTSRDNGHPSAFRSCSSARIRCDSTARNWLSPTSWISSARLSQSSEFAARHRSSSACCSDHNRMSVS
jgi:2-furoate---CoA ligase